MSRHEIESLAALDAALAGGTLKDLVVQGVSFVDRASELAAVDVTGAIFIGCTIPVPLLAALIAKGALVFPRVDGLPFATARSSLYTADELMAGYVRGEPESFKTHTADAAIYRVRHGKGDNGATLTEHLAMRLHDLSIDDALEEFLDNNGTHHRVVAVMGGHATPRAIVDANDSTKPATYLQVVRLGAALARAGFLVATGGGPGAMEAANLGAMAADLDDEGLVALVQSLSPGRYADGARMLPDYFESAWGARAKLATPRLSLAIPTWFYGHEPTNLFCSHVAKYFSNALREEGLLANARHGVVFAPESGPGTMQEVFQDVCQNAYGTYGDVSNMAFLGREFWNVTRPAPALVASMVRGKQLASRVLVADDIDEIVAFVVAHPPVKFGAH